MSRKQQLLMLNCLLSPRRIKLEKIYEENFMRSFDMSEVEAKFSSNHALMLKRQEKTRYTE